MMNGVRRFRLEPLTWFTLLSLLGFIFFTTSLVLIWALSDDVEIFLNKNFNRGLGDMTMFIVLSIINAFGFFMTFFQLLVTKPTSKRVLIPIVIFTTTTFVILIAVDFYLEVQLTHLPPKQTFTQEKPNEKGKSRFKMGYLIIYVCLCIVAGFVYLAYKDLEEFLESRKNENETNEIVISHIT